MELDYQITNIDIYKDLNKEQAINLAAQYNIKISSNYEDETLANLRQKLSITKHIFQKAQRQPNLQSPLANLFHHRELTEQDKLKHPELIEYSLIIESLYDNVETHTPQYPTLENNELKQTLTSATQNMLTNKLEEHLPLIKAGTFSGLPSEDVHEFIHRYNTASKCNHWTPQTKIDLFQTHLTGIPYKWYTLYQQQHQTINWEDLQKAFTKAFSPVALIEDLQSVLENKNQGHTESPLHFYYDILHLCKRIDPELPETKIIKYVIQGVLPNICNDLIKMDNTTLEKLEQNLYILETQNLLKEKNRRRHLTDNTPTSKDQNNTCTNQHTTTHYNSNDNDTHIQKVTRNLQREVNDLKNTLATLTVSRDTPTYKYQTQTRQTYEHHQQPYRNANMIQKQRNHYYRNTHTYPQTNRAQSNNHKYNPQHTTNKPTNIRYTYCHICKTSSHPTESCKFNLKNIQHNTSNSQQGNKTTYPFVDTYKKSTTTQHYPPQYQHKNTHFNYQHKPKNV